MHVVTSSSITLILTSRNLDECNSDLRRLQFLGLTTPEAREVECPEAGLSEYADDNTLRSCNYEQQ